MELTTIKNLADVIKTGKTPPTKEEKYFNGDIKWYTPGDLDKAKCLTDSVRTLSKTAMTDKMAAIFPEGTLLVACIGDIGKLGITTEECSSNQQITGITPKSNVSVSYLYYWFRYSKKSLQHVANNAVVPILNNRSLGQIKIPLPPLAEQQKIAAILDAADQLRQKDQQLIDHYSQLSQSLFFQMFGDPVTNPMGWEKVELDNVCKLQGGFSFKSNHYVEKGVRLVKIANVNHENLDWAEVDMLPESYVESYSSFALKTGDILMALTRPIIKSLGTVKAVTVKEADLPALLNQRVARFFPNESVLNKRYLLTVIYSNYFKHKIDGYSSTSLQPNVSNKQVQSIEILLPPVALQNQFAQHIKNIEQQKQQAQASLEKSQALFNSLLQRAFKGELTSRESRAA